MMMLRSKMLRRKTDPKTKEAHIVRACAVEIHMDTSQEPFCVEINKENASWRGNFQG